MRGCAGLDTNEARRQLLEEWQHGTTLQPRTNDHMAFRIHTVHLKNRLRDIETDSRNRLHDLAPPNRAGLNGTHIHGTLPVEEPSTASEADVDRVSSWLW
jgi:Na+-transporting NADH:ubiquinone oxidoreductase subunit NqrA